jgi:hypothetical protein
MIKTYSKEQCEELCRIAKEKYGMEYVCDMYGRFPWDTEHRGDQHKQKLKYLTLSKASLGSFVYEVLIRGGNISSFWAFALEPRSSVYPRVWMTMEMRDDFVEKVRYPMNAPPVVHLN